MAACNSISGAIAILIQHQSTQDSESQSKVKSAVNFIFEKLKESDKIPEMGSRDVKILNQDVNLSQLLDLVKNSPHFKREDNEHLQEIVMRNMRNSIEKPLDESTQKAVKDVAPKTRLSMEEQIDIKQLNKNSPILLEIDLKADATGHIAATLNLASRLVELGYEGSFNVAHNGEEEHIAKFEEEIYNHELLIPSYCCGELLAESNETKYSCVISGAFDGLPPSRTYTDDVLVMRMNPPSFKRNLTATLKVGGGNAESISLEGKSIYNPSVVPAIETPEKEIVLYNIKNFFGGEMLASEILQNLDKSLPGGVYSIRSYGFESEKKDSSEVDLAKLELKNISDFTDEGKVEQKTFAEIIAQSSLVICEGANTANLCSQIGTPYIHINRSGTQHYPGDLSGFATDCRDEGRHLQDSEETANLSKIIDLRGEFMKAAEAERNKPDPFLTLLENGLTAQKKLQQKPAEK